MNEFLFINQPLQRFIFTQASSMGVDLSDVAARNILESKFLEERVPNLLDSGKYEEALPLAERYAELAPDDPHAQAALYTAKVFYGGSVEVQESITAPDDGRGGNPCRLGLTTLYSVLPMHLNRREKAKGANRSRRANKSTRSSRGGVTQRAVGPIKKPQKKANGGSPKSATRRPSRATDVDTASHKNRRRQFGRRPAHLGFGHTPGDGLPEAPI